MSSIVTLRLYLMNMISKNNVVKWQPFKTQNSKFRFDLIGTWSQAYSWHGGTLLLPCGSAVWFFKRCGLQSVKWAKTAKIGHFGPFWAVLRPLNCWIQVDPDWHYLLPYSFGDFYQKIGLQNVKQAKTAKIGRFELFWGQNLAQSNMIWT